MKILSFNASLKQTNFITFSSQTCYEKKKIIEKDLLTMDENKYLDLNYNNPKQDIIKVRLEKESPETITLTSQFNHKIGKIDFNKNALQPKINLQAGSFQPMIELSDDELGITILMTRGSALSGENLNIDYKNLTKSVSFGHRLVVSTGYKGDELKENVRNSFAENNIKTVSDLKNDYTFVALGGGYGTRLCPISDLTSSNKPTTLYPGSKKNLFSISVTDPIKNVGSINDIKFIDENEENLSGTAGVIIKGLKNGTIPLDKPLVLLTGDIFHDIDLSQAIKTFENDNSCGIGVIVKRLEEKDILNNALIKFSTPYYVDGKTAFEVTDLSPKVTNDNKSQIISDYYTLTSDGLSYYTSTNFMILHPRILNILKDFANNEGKSDFVQFLGLMFNTLNKKQESLSDKYPNDLDAENLKISDLADYYTGYPKDIRNEDGNNFKVKAIVAKNNKGNNPVWADAGTVEDYIKVIRNIKAGNDIALEETFLNSVRENVDDNGVIHINNSSKTKLEEFKKKYNISDISGNVIVYANPKIQVKKETSENIFTDKSLSLLPNIANIEVAKNKINKLVQKYGIQAFLSWYLSNDGYYGAYEKFLNDYFENANSIEDLIKFQPNWAPWKLEEKKWLLENSQYKNLSFEDRKRYINSYWDSIREIPFEIGKLPEIFSDKNTYTRLINRLKSEDIKEDSVYINYERFDVKRLKGGEYNNKFIYIVSNNDKKYILKFERINIEDADTLNYRNLSLFEKKAIRKEKYLSADSIYTNACISKYLELNGCTCVPKLEFYDHQTHSAVFECIEDINDDAFQHDLINEEYMELETINKKFKELNDLGIYLNDSAYKNILTRKSGKEVFIDLGHSNFIHPLKPGVKRFNIEFANTNGPDLKSIYAGVLISILK